MYGPQHGHNAIVSMHEHDADRAGQQNVAQNGPQGPRCSNPKCRKPKWSVIGGVPTKLLPEQGGCGCPRYSEPPPQYIEARTREERRDDFLETLTRIGLAICAHFKIELPQAAAPPPEPKSEPTGVAAIDQIRAGDRANRRTG